MTVDINTCIILCGLSILLLCLIPNVRFRVRNIKISVYYELFCNLFASICFGITAVLFFVNPSWNWDSDLLVKPFGADGYIPPGIFNKGYSSELIGGYVVRPVLYVLAKIGPMGCGIIFMGLTALFLFKAYQSLKEFKDISRA